MATDAMAADALASIADASADLTVEAGLLPRQWQQMLWSEAPEGSANASVANASVAIADATE